ncbi:helix-turn-helix domain-containing protein [Streptoverticillium reticulum]|uniref:helix-turn-helix domain-containing protein n=1 Tax=Streptoverticillium reticulum TaxID=1433415 RepID=UPI0039BFE4B0
MPRPADTRPGAERLRKGQELRPRFEAGTPIHQLAEETGLPYVSVHADLKLAGAPVPSRPLGTLADITGLKDRYEAGASPAELAAEYRCSLSLIRTRLKQAGTRMRPVGGIPAFKRAPELTVKAVGLYHSGYSVRGVAAACGASYGRIYNVLTQAGVRLRPQGRAGQQAARAVAAGRRQDQAA